MLIGASPEADLLRWTDLVRAGVSARLDPRRKAELAQFFTPLPTARVMASLFGPVSVHARLLDAGAGVGSLTAAWVAEMCARDHRPERISVTAFELDPGLEPHLGRTLDACRSLCERVGIEFDSTVHREDFVSGAVAALRGGFFAPQIPRFDYAILNPPYRKITTDSESRLQLRQVGIEVSNLYAAFLALAMHLLRQGGEMVAITPRSFANGPYFRHFRREFLSEMALRQILVFDDRDRAFRDDDVLQENIILHAVKCRSRPSDVIVSTSAGPEDAIVRRRLVPYPTVVQPDDADAFIRVVPTEEDGAVAAKMAQCQTSLEDLGISVSTGRVVDFRASRFLRPEPSADTAPLIYPVHFDHGYVRWPSRSGKKPNAIAATPETARLLVPEGSYVLTRRFSSKEERRRIVAAIYDPGRLPPGSVGFENHLNYYHNAGAGLDPLLAKGLAAFLNSTLVDSYFRQFNGHTQVNATDLRSFRYPTRGELESLGRSIDDRFPRQSDLDRLIVQELG